MKLQIKPFVAIHTRLASSTKPMLSWRNVDSLVLNSNAVSFKLSVEAPPLRDSELETGIGGQC